MPTGNGRAAALGAAMVVLSAVPLLWLEAAPRDRTHVAAVFAPWLSADAAFAQALASGGEVVRPGAWRWILIVRGDAADLPERLYAAGAWAVIDPAALGGCLSARHRGEE
jgi:hypothetical protein